MPSWLKSFSIAALIFVTLALLACSDTIQAPPTTRTTVITSEEDITGSPYESAYGQPLRWNAGSITFAFASNFPAQYEAPCLAAAQTWNQVMGENFIKFASPPQNNMITWGAKPVPPNLSEAAVTSYQAEGMSEKSMYMIRANIDFDAQMSFSVDASNSQAVDVQSVCLHEFGHSLGLAHVADQSSIMYPVIVDGTWKRSPSQDDIQNLRQLYGL